MEIFKNGQSNKFLFQFEEINWKFVKYKALFSTGVMV